MSTISSDTAASGHKHFRLHLPHSHRATTLADARRREVPHDVSEEPQRSTADQTTLMAERIETLTSALSKRILEWEPAT